MYTTLYLCKVYDYRLCLHTSGSRSRRCCCLSGSCRWQGTRRVGDTNAARTSVHHGERLAEACLDRGVLLQVGAEELLPAGVPLRYVLIVGRRVEPNAEHVEPLGKERALEHLDQSLLRQQIVPVHCPIPCVHALLARIDNKLGVEDGAQLADDVSLQERVPARLAKDWRLPRAQHRLGRHVRRMPVRERVGQLEAYLRKERRLQALLEQRQPRMNPRVDGNAIRETKQNETLSIVHIEIETRYRSVLLIRSTLEGHKVFFK